MRVINARYYSPAPFFHARKKPTRQWDLPVLLTSIFIASSFAFAPSDDVHIGQEPTRLLRFNPERQHALRHSLAWQDFIDGDGHGWRVRFDERTQTVFRAWGEGIDIGQIESKDDAMRSLDNFFKQNPGLLGVSSTELRMGPSGYDENTDTWFIQLDRVVTPLAQSDHFSAPIPVYRAAVEARVRFGKLIMFGVNTHPNASHISTTAQISSDDAIDIAISQGPASDAEHTFDTVSPVILPFNQGSGVGYRLCWEVRTSTSDPIGRWVSFIDVKTGELVNVHNEIRFVSGSVNAVHDLRTIDGETTTSPVPFAYVTGNASDSTDEDGIFETSNSDPVTELNGALLRVRNEDGDEAQMYLDEGTNTWSNENATIAEIDSYIFLQEILAWAEIYAPHVNDAWGKVNSYVNRDDSCNAFFDGDVTFYKAGNGCNNTARIADVNHHEWGHGFHYYNMLSGDWDGSVGEGVGDTIAVLQSGDNIMAPYFMTNGNGIRNVAPNRVYPDDWVNEVHTDGLIFAGAVWDLWGELSDKYGADESLEVLTPIFVSALRAGPTTPETYDEFIVADDDNGDLSDGTPNQCEIINAFAEHGLGPGGGSALFSLSHEALNNQSPQNTEYAIDADLLSFADECSGFELNEVEVHYRTNRDSSWQTVTLDPFEGSATGAIPRQEQGTVVEYYLSATSTDGANTMAPLGGEITPLSFFVGELVELYCEKFELDDGGYTSQLISGDNNEGADDWMWGTPNGTASDPDFAISGDKVWGNDLGGTVNGQPYNGEYQSDKHNRLSSIPIDTSGQSQLLIQFQRWLNVEDGYYDQAQVLINDDVVWTNHTTESNIGDEHHQDSQWAQHSLFIEENDAEEVILSWDIISDSGLEFGGWNIDDVCVYGFTVVDIDTDSGETGGNNTPDNSMADDWSYGACSCASTSNPIRTGTLLVCLVALAGFRRRRS